MSEVPDTGEQPPRVAIGISFGNSNSSIAYTTAAEGKAEVIANEEGDRQIPSILSYVAGEEYQGTQAKSQIVRNPRNTIACFRDFLGKEYGAIDPTPCHSSAHPVEVDGDKSVGFKIQEGAADEDADEPSREESLLTVSEVTTRHLRRLKQSASDFLGKEVTAAVITIPSNFSDVQKETLRSASEKSGIEILQCISEPVASLLGYDAKVQQTAEGPAAQSDKIVVVADLGATRSDVSVIASRGGIYTTISTVHDYELGGTSLDKLLVDYAAKEFLKKHKTAKDPREDPKGLAKLTLEAENVKKALSLGTGASFSVESLSDGIDFSLTLNRSRFELLSNKTFFAFTRLIETAVHKAALDVLDIDMILLSGGTAHTPKIANNLITHFPEETIVVAPSTNSSAINPSELAARGAAIQASLISEFERADIEASTEAVVTVTPHLAQPLGVITQGKDGKDEFHLLIAADTPVPVRKTVQIAVPRGGDVLLRLGEGVREIDVRKEDAPKVNGKGKGSDEDGENDDDSEEDPEEFRTKIFRPGKVIAEAGFQGVQKGARVEMQVNVGADCSITIVSRQLGGKGGIRGSVEAPNPVQNGSAS